jgi:branched-chain amino acid transport system permease protein
MAAPNPSANHRVVHWDRSSQLGMIAVSATVIGLAAAPVWGDRSTLRTLTEVYSYVALASLWNLLAGYAGLVSIGQQAFVGLGGYTLFLSALWLGLNPLLGVPIAAVLAGLFAIPVALLLFRLRGAYFTIGCWVVADVLQQVFLQIDAVGGGSGISLPASIVKSMAASRDARESLVYWTILAIMLLIVGVIVMLLRSRWGLALQAIRDNEMAAKANGVDVDRARLVVFVLAAACTAMVGAMIFLQRLTITPVSAFSINDWTVNVIFITVIGGIGRIEGPIVGTIIYMLLRGFLSDLGSVYQIILGVFGILIMLRAPKGLWGYVADRFGWQVFPLARRFVWSAAPARADEGVREAA